MSFTFNVISDKSDVVIRMMLTLYIFSEVYVGILLIDYYKTHKEWFTRISKRIRLFPPIWMIQIIWAFVYFMLGSSIYLFYKNANDILNNNKDHTVDSVTFLFIVNIMLNKLYPFVFLKMRLVRAALLMITLNILTSVGIAILFALNGKWTEFGTFLPYPLWASFLFYINLMFVIIKNEETAT